MKRTIKHSFKAIKPESLFTRAFRIGPYYMHIDLDSESLTINMTLSSSNQKRVKWISPIKPEDFNPQDWL